MFGFLTKISDFVNKSLDPQAKEYDDFLKQGLIEHAKVANGHSYSISANEIPDYLKKLNDLDLEFRAKLLIYCVRHRGIATLTSTNDWLLRSLMTWTAGR
jgi:hypothetical protein